MDALKQIEAVVAGKRRFAALHADCLDVGRLIRPGVFDACIINPPYGMSYRGKNDLLKPIANDERPFIWWLYDAFRVLKPGASLACFCQWKAQEDWKTAIRLAGFDVRSHVVWNRHQYGMGHPGMTFAPSHDVIWFATKGRFRFPAGRPLSVLSHPNVPARSRRHSTEKPLGLMAELVRRLTPRGGIVYDPCMGSGSTGEAALKAGCRFVGVEVDAENFAIAEARLKSIDFRPRHRVAPPSAGRFIPEQLAGAAA